MTVCVNKRGLTDALTTFVDNPFYHSCGVSSQIKFKVNILLIKINVLFGRIVM